MKTKLLTIALLLLGVSAGAQKTFYHSPNIQHLLGCNNEPGISVYNNNLYEVYYANKTYGTSTSPAISTTNMSYSDIITEPDSTNNCQTADGWIFARVSDIGSASIASAMDEFEMPIRSFAMVNNDSLVLRVAGYSEFSLYANDNHTDSSRLKYLDVIIDGVVQPLSLSNTPSIRRYSISSGKHHIRVVGNGTSSNRVYAFSLRPDSTVFIRHQIYYSSNNDAWGKVEPVLLDDCQPDLATLKAIPAPGARFSQWNDGVTTNPRTWTFTQDTTVEAIFIRDTTKYTLTLLSNDENMGHVIGSGTYHCNEPTTIYAEPWGRYRFVRWSDGSYEEKREIKIEKDTEITAYFAKQKSTGGTDFWITTLPTDLTPIELSLTISARSTATVQVSNPYLGYRQAFQVPENGTYKLVVPIEYCHVRSNDSTESPLPRALHIESDYNVSVVSANYREKSFDATMVIPTQELESNYKVMCYTPSNHSEISQGSHFAIVATEDNTIVDIIPTANTYGGHLAGVPFSTGVLKQGQVYYVWTGTGAGTDYDLSGTTISARNGKKIAVFSGNTMTNLPWEIRDRDHIYTQVLPNKDWGTDYVVTSSYTTIEKQEGLWERIDKVRVMALEDGTNLYIDGKKVHTFQQESAMIPYYEFDFGLVDSLSTYQRGEVPYFAGVSHVLTADKPIGVYQFLTSNRYDHSRTTLCYADPALFWVTPLSESNTDISFSTFGMGGYLFGEQYLNVVICTRYVGSARLDGMSIAAHFQPVEADNAYSYARIKISNGYHMLSAEGGMVAHVYGEEVRGAYAYSIGTGTDYTCVMEMDTETAIVSANQPSYVWRDTIQSVYRGNIYSWYNQWTREQETSYGYYEELLKYRARHDYNNCDTVFSLLVKYMPIQHYLRYDTIYRGEAYYFEYGADSTYVYFNNTKAADGRDSLIHEYHLTILPLPSYAISVQSSDTTLGTTSGSGVYARYDTVVISASAKTGYTFVAWNDGNTENPRMITMMQDTSFVATFATKMCTLTIISNIEEAADITGAGTYEYGQSVTCKIDLMSGYQFVKWSNGKTYNPYKFKIYDDMTLYAFLEEDGGAPIAPDSVVVTPNENNANLQWPQVDNAYSYTITITKGGEVICTLTFNGLGQLTSINFAAPSRGMASAAPGFNFTVTGLQSGTTYSYRIEAKDEKGEVLSTESGAFTTSVITTNLYTPEATYFVVTKFLHDGHILIQRAGNTYNLRGQRIK